MLYTTKKTKQVRIYNAGGWEMKKAKWLSKLNASDHCPVCGIEISAKQKRKIPVSHFYIYECPECHAHLYLKGGWIMHIYAITWGLITLVSGLFIFDSYIARRLSVFIYLILASIGATWFIMPFLTIKVKK